MKQSKSKSDYYSLDRILKTESEYNVIIGSRSNGKTTSVLLYMLERYCNHGEEFAVIRRWADDFKQQRGNTLFNAIERMGLIQKYTNNEWTNIVFQSMRFYFGRYQNGKLVLSEKPIGYCYAVSQVEHDKGSSVNVINILFDEFMTRSEYGYLTNEFVLFQNTISTLIRERGDRDKIKIFMCGNTVTFFCPYFHEMGLTNIKKMKPGDIDVYTYGDSGLRVAVEYAEPFKGKSNSNKYFAFNNPRLKMITGADGGSWEIDIYPHLLEKYKPNQIMFTYFIIFDGMTLQCEVIKYKSGVITYIHRKTTDIRYPDKDIVFSIEPNNRRNWNTNILKIHNPSLKQAFSRIFDTSKFFYQDNEVGEYMRNYLIWCKKN